MLNVKLGDIVEIGITDNKLPTRNKDDIKHYVKARVISLSIGDNRPYLLGWKRDEVCIDSSFGFLIEEDGIGSHYDSIKEAGQYYHAIWVNIDYITKVCISERICLRCVKCKEPNEYAEPNQKDGSYKCYRCRNW